MAKIRNTINVEDGGGVYPLPEYIINLVRNEINNKILEDNKNRYYIGRIVINTSGTNPHDYLGFGEWEQYGKGKVLVGLDSNDTDFSTINKTGGEKVHTLTTSEIPSHNHSFTGASHSHNFSTTSGGQSANHTHSYDKMASHSHGLNTSSSGAAMAINTDGSVQYAEKKSTVTSTKSFGSSGSGWTGKSISNSTQWAAQLVGDTSVVNTSSVSTGINSVSHTHSVSGTTDSATQSGTIGNSGSGYSHNNLQPYIVVYFWRRTA